MTTFTHTHRVDAAIAKRCVKLIATAMGRFNSHKVGRCRRGTLRLEGAEGRLIDDTTWVLKITYSLGVSRYLRFKTGGGSRKFEAYRSTDFRKLHKLLATHKAPPPTVVPSPPPTPPSGPSEPA